MIKLTKFATIHSMKKSQIIELIGNAPEIAKRLEYAHRNVVYGWPDELSKRQSADVVRRMKAKRIPIPKEWLISLATEPLPAPLAR